ncbi:G-protein coupled peptide receptor [Aureococcus anophagefferens]|nr:G-protein coupled peptide receptor [Aureococcus anophagefferens]
MASDDDLEPKTRCGRCQQLGSRAFWYSMGTSPENEGSCRIVIMGWGFLFIFMAFNTTQTILSTVLQHYVGSVSHVECDLGMASLMIMCVTTCRRSTPSRGDPEPRGRRDDDAGRAVLRGAIISLIYIWEPTVILSSAVVGVGQAAIWGIDSQGFFLFASVCTLVGVFIFRLLAKRQRQEADYDGAEARRRAARDDDAEAPGSAPLLGKAAAKLAGASGARCAGGAPRVAPARLDAGEGRRARDSPFMFFIGSSDGFINGAFPIIFAPTAVQEGAVFLVFLGDTLNNTQAYALIGDYFATPPLNVDAYAAFQLLQAVGMAFGFGIPLVLTTEWKHRAAIFGIQAATLLASISGIAMLPANNTIGRRHAPPAPMGHAASTYEKAQDGEPWDAKPVEFFGGDAGAHFAPVPPQFESVRRRFSSSSADGSAARVAYVAAKSLLNGPEDTLSVITVESSKAHTKPNFKPKVMRDRYEADLTGFLARSRWRFITIPKSKVPTKEVVTTFVNDRSKMPCAVRTHPDPTLVLVGFSGRKTSAARDPAVIGQVADLSLRTLFCPTVVAKVAPRPRGRHFVMLVEPAERSNAPDTLMRMLSKWKARANFEFVEHGAGLRERPPVRHYHRNIVIIKSVLGEPGRRSSMAGRSGVVAVAADGHPSSQAAAAPAPA